MAENLLESLFGRFDARKAGNRKAERLKGAAPRILTLQGYGILRY
jgi:hypothetical protein